MKIKYEFATGAEEIEVSDDIGAEIIISRREEENLERKERYHCYSLDSFMYGDKDDNIPTAKDTPESVLMENIKNEKIHKAFMNLSDIQKRRISMLADGISMREISRREGKDIKTIRESIDSARKKFLKFF